jgi:glucose-1-phosphatase
MNKKKIILFDLGGVLINVDYNLTKVAFEQLGIDDFNTLFSQAQQNDVFSDYETGKISSFHFINKLLDLLPEGTTANQVVHAWNAMILDFPIERMNYLEKLAEKSQLFVLSNTNDIHVEKALRNLKKVTDKKLEDYFTEVFYSHEIGDRKPNVSAFELVLGRMNANAEDVLFIDDSIQHVEAAKSLGIETIHLTQELLTHPYFS